MGISQLVSHITPEGNENVSRMGYARGYLPVA